MNAPLDLDQLATFAAIADSGSFTRAADAVHRTQSAVSMQMRRLEERVGKPLFERDGRMNRLTGEGERLLAFARRLLQLNRETLAAFDETSLEGQIRIGMPDDYAERFLPEIMGRFSRSNPRVEMSVVCEPTVNLAELVRRGQLDIAVVTKCDDVQAAEIVRTEPLLWVTSANHAIHEEHVLSTAFGRPTCAWRAQATAALEAMGRPYRILFTSWSATVILAAVQAGLAVSALAECALRPGMRVLSEADGFPALEAVQIGILRGRTNHPALTDALARHISESLYNLAPALADTADFASLARRAARPKPGLVTPGW